MAATGKAIAAAGRHTDDQAGHLTSGEVIIPTKILEASPDIGAALERRFKAFGTDISRYTVGSDANSINPETGLAEFWGLPSWDDIKSVASKVVAPVVQAVTNPLLSPFGASLPGMATKEVAKQTGIIPPDPAAPTQPGMAATTRIDTDAMRRKLDAMPGPTSIAPETGGYQAKDVSGPLAEYDYARKKSAESINTQNSTNQDALARRFASMGMLNSGAAVKQSEIQDQNTAQARADSNEGINAQEATARRGLQTAEENKVFQSGEAIKGRNAQAQQFNASQAFQDKVFRMDQNTKLAGLDMQQNEFDRQMSEDEFNKELARYQQQHTGGLLGAGGFAGTGIG